MSHCPNEQRLPMVPKTLGATQGTRPSGQGQGQRGTLQPVLHLCFVTIPGRAATQLYR